MIKNKIRKYKEKVALNNIVNSTRNIQTTYYDHGGNVLRINKSVHAHLAVAKAVDYMQLDYYQAKTVEVFDCADGTLHAVISWKNQSLVILYKRDPREFV